MKTHADMHTRKDVEKCTSETKLEICSQRYAEGVYEARLNILTLTKDDNNLGNLVHHSNDTTLVWLLFRYKQRLIIAQQTSAFDTSK